MGEKERLTRRFTEEVLNIIGPRVDVMAPDMGTDEQTMAWIYDTYSMKVGYACPEIVTGKPVELGGCVGRQGGDRPRSRLLHPRGHGGTATSARRGHGGRSGIRQRRLGDVRGTRQARRQDHRRRRPLRRDSQRARHRHRRAAGHTRRAGNDRKTIVGFPGAEEIDPKELLTTPCTLLVPAALERVITAENAGRLKCRILAEGANGPTTPEADAILARSDIFVIPDILCNAGGVTVSYFEWVQDLQQFMWGEEQVNAQLQKLMHRSIPPRPRGGARRRS